MRITNSTSDPIGGYWRLAFSLIVLLLVVGPAPADVEVEVRHWRLRDVSVTLAVCDPAITRISVELAIGTDPGAGVWRSEGMGHLVGRLDPLAAMTGCYFDMATNIPVCTIVSDGELLVPGICHSYLMVDGDDVRICYAGTAGEVSWPIGLSVGVAGGPILVRDGRYHDDKWDEGFHDPGIFGVARRTAVGTTEAGKLVLMATNDSISLRRWSQVALDAGLTDAFTMDGGTSAALYVLGEHPVHAGRRLTNFLVVSSG